MARLEGARVIVEEGASQALAERVRVGRPAPRGDVPGRRGAAPRARRGWSAATCCARRSSSRSPPAHPLAGGDAVALAELAGEGWTAPSADGHHRAHLPRRGLRAADLLDHARPAGDPRARRARARRHARAEHCSPTRSAIATCRCGRSPARAPERDVYALLPPGGRHPLAGAAFAALAAAVEASRRVSSTGGAAEAPRGERARGYRTRSAGRDIVSVHVARQQRRGPRAVVRAARRSRSRARRGALALALDLERAAHERVHAAEVRVLPVLRRFGVVHVSRFAAAVKPRGPKPSSPESKSTLPSASG